MLARVKTPKSLTRTLRRPSALLGAGALAASLALTGCSGSDTEAAAESVPGGLAAMCPCPRGRAEPTL